MSTTYSTRDEAIEREIIEPLGDYVSDFDVEAIADEVLGDYNDGYACKVSPNEFWDIANLHHWPIEREPYCFNATGFADN